MKVNNINLIGRLTAAPEIRYSQGDQPIAYGSYTIACDRPVRSGAEKITDFIYCKVVGKNAEFTEKYLQKGMKIAITGRLQVDSYTDREGNKRSTTYVQVQNQEFCESKASSGNTAPAATQTSPYGNMPTDSDGFMSVPDGIDEELPFN